MLDKLAKEYYNKLYHMPPNPSDLKEFAELVLNNFIEELLKNKQGVAWNSGFDGVIFADKSVDGHKSLMQIKEEFLGQASNASDTTVSQGTGVSGNNEGDSSLRSDNQLSKDKQCEVQSLTP